MQQRAIAFSFLSLSLIHFVVLCVQKEPNKNLKVQPNEYTVSSNFFFTSQNPKTEPFMFCFGKLQGNGDCVCAF